MTTVEIIYNPYTVTTDIIINGEKIEDSLSPLTYVQGKRLQEWIEPKGNWPGIFRALRSSTGDDHVTIEFTGTFGDFDDLSYANNRYGKRDIRGECFADVILIHKNKDTAGDIDPFQKMAKLKQLYDELQNGPVEEFKTPDIQKNFDTAINSDFRIVVVAPMSSGKSTLINAIIGKDLLPAVNQATTAVITEIKDNDELKDFVVNASDKYGNVIVDNWKATKKLISDLNYKKDPKDPEKKEAFIHLVKIEGPIPNIPSDVLNTVFVDTPGGNNSQNVAHEEMMDEAINDENKSMILYVFNGAQLGTDDSNIILKKIANAMQNSTNGKQSRDRFLFVANRMDDFDVSVEPYEEVINNTILPQLASNGITEPNLFLASAQTAKLIRMVENGASLTETEEEDLDKLIKRFNRPTRMLSQYASLNSADKESLKKQAEEYTQRGQEANDINEATENKYKAAEINSGIPAIELAIKEYLEKYAIAIKIKNVHDTFMKKVYERNMINHCREEWASSEASFNKAKEEVQLKQNQYSHDLKLQELKNKVDAVELDTTSVISEQAKVNRQIDLLVDQTKQSVEKSEAEYLLKQFSYSLEQIGQTAKVTLENSLNNGVQKICSDIVDEYAAYINELDSEGTFNIGGYDIKKTEKFSKFRMDRPETLVNEYEYQEKKQVKVGSHKEKEKGFMAFFLRIFKAEGGYKTVDEYENRTFIDLRRLVQDQVTQIQHDFDREVRDQINISKKKVESLKSFTKKKLDGLDQLVANTKQEIDRMLENQYILQKKVKENEEKTKWINNFIQKVDDLLAV